MWPSFQLGVQRLAPCSVVACAAGQPVRPPCAACCVCCQVRMEEASAVTPEDIQFAVQQALFAAERARSKRLRREDSGLMMQA